MTIFFILAVFWPEKGQKKSQNREKKFAAFSLIGKHLHTKFQKISLNGLDFDNFLNFWPKNTKKEKKGQNRKSGFEMNIYLLRIFFVFGKKRLKGQTSQNPKSGSMVILYFLGSIYI